MVRAELCRNEMQRKAWLKEADCALQRKTKLQQSSKLEDAHLVADAEMAVENRSSLEIGMSGQVSLWAKAPSKKFVFSADELKGASWDDRKRWTEIREELKAAQVQAAAEGYQLASWADVGAGPLKVAGNKVMKGQSSDEKFRITYEARQKIYNIGAPAGTALQGDYCGARSA